MELTQEIVRELLDYDPETGLLTWKERDVKWFVDGKRTAKQSCFVWNKLYMGKQALTSFNNDGYKLGSVLKIQVQAHRLIWLYMTGEWPEYIDHINGIRDDNRWENLREVSSLGNNRNKGVRNDNKSGYRGVHKVKNRWRARIQYVLNGISISEHIGYFDTLEEAHAAYAKVAKLLGFTDRHIYGD